MIPRKSTLTLVILPILTAFAALAYAKVDQPVKFNHNLHIVENGMDCTECHQYVSISRKATLPGKSVCLGCHSEPIGESPEEKKLISILESDQDLEWQRIYYLPKHIYFSHFRHVTLGQIGCQNCHGEMENLTSPPEKPAVDIINMNNCISCHNDKLVSNDCLTCHF